MGLSICHVSVSVVFLCKMYRLRWIHTALSHVCTLHFLTCARCTFSCVHAALSHVCTLHFLTCARCTFSRVHAVLSHVCTLYFLTCARCTFSRVHAVLSFRRNLHHNMSCWYRCHNEWTLVSDGPLHQSTLYQTPRHHYKPSFSLGRQWTSESISVCTPKQILCS